MFKRVDLTSEFFCDAASQQVRLVARSMGLSAVGRWFLWFKLWEADLTSKYSLANLPFVPGQLFSSELDRFMEDLSDKKDKSLPQAPKVIVI